MEITGVAATPYCARRAEEELRGSLPGARDIGTASKLAAEEVDPLSDLHASAEYRRELARRRA